jgi:hypothetical protein
MNRAERVYAETHAPEPVKAAASYSNFRANVRHNRND